MDELSRAYIHGQAGLDKINDAMSGDLRGALIAQAVEQVTEPDAPRPRSTYGPPARLPFPRFRAALLAVALTVLAIIILVH
jgi:hypothetical protein